jgi:hypothetical protein
MYINLPGSYVQLQDGNLRTFARDNTQSVLVVGTASKGLTSEPFVALDLLSVVNEFGATSEVAKTVAEVRKGGATNIYVFRLPGVAPELTNIGSDVETGDEEPALGISIRTLQESPEAAPKYGVAYRHAKNIATSGTGAADDKVLTAELIVVNLGTSEVVWQGSALEGSTLDTGEVDVQFSLGDVDAGAGFGAEQDSVDIAVTSGSRSYTGVASAYQASGLGSGATFTVAGVPTFATGPYSSTTVSAVAPGDIYAVGDQLKVLGSALGGVNTANDLTFNVATIAATARTYAEVPLTQGTATDARATIGVSATGVYSVTITTQGTGYTAGNITVLGTALGGASPANDATIAITVTSGAITGAAASGNGKLRGGVTGVNTVAGTHAVPGATAFTYTLSMSGVTATGTVTAGQPYTSADAVAAALAIALNANAEFEKLPFSASAVNNATLITADGTVNTDGEVVYGASHTWAGYTARPYFQSAPTITFPAGQGTATVTGIATVSARASDIGLYPQDVTKPFAAAGGGIYVPLDKVVSGGSFKSYGLGGTLYSFASRESYAALNFDETTTATFSVGQTGESISLMKRFEKLHTAFENLDLASFDFIVPVGVALNSKNTADMIASTNVDFFTDDTYPTPRNAFDYLGYCAIVNNGDYTYTYLWSDDGENLKIASDGPIAAHASDSVTYNEVNFAHLLAKYCYENSTDYRFIYGLIGTTLPDGVSPRSIRAYFGSAPDYQFNADDNTFYVPDSSYNGIGLLGNKFVGGRHDFNDGLKHGGFFLTSDGTLDYSSSNLLLDDNGYKIDIGKHIGVVSIFGRVSDDINSRRNPYFTNAVAIVAGMLPNTSPSDSLINRRVSGLTIDYRLETKLIDVACGLGLIVAKNEGGIASIADSPTFASPTSDYTRLTTIRIVSKICEDLRLAARPYIGKGLSAPRRAALEAALGEVLKANIAGEPIQTITGGTFRIEQSAADKVLGKMKIKVSITPVFELRQIIFSVNLSAQ